MSRKSNQVSLEPYGYTLVDSQPIAPMHASESEVKPQAVQSNKIRNRIYSMLFLLLVGGILVADFVYDAKSHVSSPANNDPMYVARRQAVIPFVSHTSAYHNVVYKVTTSRDWGGCYGFDTTYEMPSGTAQKSVAACDSSPVAVVDQRLAQDGDFVYLSVQNDEQSANISCQIWIDNRLVYETHSEGQFVIASCSGSVN